MTVLDCVTVFACGTVLDAHHGQSHTVNQAEVQDLQRREACLRSGSYPLAPAPPPTPVHSSLAHVLWTEDGAAPECMDTDGMMMDHTVQLTFMQTEGGQDWMEPAQPSGRPPLPPLNTSGNHVGDVNTASSPTAGVLAYLFAYVLHKYHIRNGCCVTCSVHGAPEAQKTAPPIRQPPRSLRTAQGQRGQAPSVQGAVCQGSTRGGGRAPRPTCWRGTGRVSACRSIPVCCACAYQPCLQSQPIPDIRCISLLL